MKLMRIETKRTRLVALIGLGFTAVMLVTLAAHARDRMSGVPRHQSRLEGTLGYSIAMPKSEYRSDERIIVYQLITNLAKRPIDICETCFLEGVSVRPSQDHPEVVCGWFADHVPGFKARRLSLLPGETHEEQYDVTDLPCAFGRFGPGEYVVSGVYCHERPRASHGIDSPEYCIDAAPIVIHVKESAG
jgi:hypothetical protein